MYLTKRQVETEQLDKDGDNETEYEYSIKLYSEEDCGRMHDILTKLMPEERIPEPVKDPSFIANMEQYTVKQQIPPTMADIFTGSATVSKAFQQNGWRVGTTCESGHEQQKCVKKVHNHVPIRSFKDLTPEHLAGHFLVFASPPCAAFSKAGNRL